ncbi:MAG TPA: organic hydroperoxide resistance protein [Gemmatimonadaceae bacterium]|jgi:Ohr subfamily peroxiredoxin|nr:organic hydroperoxide resistance protein [Gemmatimonadaceae bacterium]
MKLETVQYTAKTHTTGGRDGHARSDDGRLNVTLASPASHATGTNPEQLFAAGWSACFLSALAYIARGEKVVLPPNASIEAEVDLGKIAKGFGLAARLNVSLPGIDRAVAQKLVEAAHQVCPYSNATRGNVDVTLTVLP